MKHQGMHAGLSAQTPVGAVPAVNPCPLLVVPVITPPGPAVLLAEADSAEGGGER